MSEESKKENIQYTLPNGQVVQLHRLTAQDHDVINRWVQKEYLSNLGTVLDLIPANEHHQFLLAAMEHVKTMTFLFGEGFEIINGSVFGLGKIAYQMVDNPTMSFESFNELFFGGRFYTPEGTKQLQNIVEAVYGTPVVTDIPINIPVASAVYGVDVSTDGESEEDAG